ncbi:MAG: outer membrane protein assembly factor BamD [Deltaproteobacteria bacterium]|nr:outer membrane protein assembly factor BamD [Deltaproteobacteria bacterium]
MMTSRSIITVTFLASFALACAREPSLPTNNADAELQRCLRLSDKRRYEEAVECLEMVKARYPSSRVGQEAELRIGDAYFNKKEYLLASESYLAFLKLYPRSPRVDYAHYRAGLSYYHESPKAIDRDQEYLDDAINHFTTVIQSYPTSAYRSLSDRFLKDARRRVARRNFYVGRFYTRTGEYIAALPRLIEVAEDYPDSGLAPRALYLATKANIELDRIEAAKTTFSKLSLEYPNERWTKKAERELLSASKKSLKPKEE